MILIKFIIDTIITVVILATVGTLTFIITFIYKSIKNAIDFYDNEIHN